MRTATLHIDAPDGVREVTLEDELTIGRTPPAGLVLGDSGLSRKNTTIFREDDELLVVDEDSTNGTFLNGERIWAPQRLRHGDEVRVGRTRLLFRNSSDVGRTVTEAEAERPTLTPREHDVLAVLCRPLLDRDLFTEPSSIREIATDLVVSEAAIKAHLANLYLKFDVEEGASNRRSRLANEALRRGAVTLADLRGREGER